MTTVPATASKLAAVARDLQLPGVDCSLVGIERDRRRLRLVCASPATAVVVEVPADDGTPLRTAVDANRFRDACRDRQTIELELSASEVLVDGEPLEVADGAATSDVVPGIPAIRAAVSGRELLAAVRTLTGILGGGAEICVGIHENGLVLGGRANALAARAVVRTGQATATEADELAASAAT